MKLLFILGFLLLLAAYAESCKCVQPVMCQTFARSPNVIRATIRSRIRTPTAKGTTIETNRIQYRIKITSVFKSKLKEGKKIAISTSSSSASCGMQFQTGEDWLMFLDDDLSTNSCAGNRLWRSLSPQEKAFLRDPRPCLACRPIRALDAPAAVAAASADDATDTASRMRGGGGGPGNDNDNDNNDDRDGSGPGGSRDNDNNDRWDNDRDNDNDRRIGGGLQPIKYASCTKSQRCEPDELGVAQCLETCSTKQCLIKGQICRQQRPSDCTSPVYPCPATAVCVANPCSATTCPVYHECRVTEEGNPSCAPTCTGRTCPVAGQTCQYSKVVCVTTPCWPQAECRCDVMCANIWEPVCGSDGNDYGSACHVRAENCRRLSESPPLKAIAVAYQGACRVPGCSLMKCSRGYQCTEDKRGRGTCSPSCKTMTCDDDYYTNPYPTPSPPSSGKRDGDGNGDNRNDNDNDSPGRDREGRGERGGGNGGAGGGRSGGRGQDTSDSASSLTYKYPKKCRLVQPEVCASGSSFCAAEATCVWCPGGCPKNLALVCGSDGMTYSNACMLEQANCDADEGTRMIRMLHTGACKPK